MKVVITVTIATVNYYTKILAKLNMHRLLLVY